MQSPVRVLLVDDVAAFRSVARAYLSEISEVELIGEASGGDEALEQMVRLQPDLILMDIHMARGNGLATTRQIRTLEDAPRVVLFSLQSDDAMRRAAFAAGADGFFSKSEFVQGVVTALGRLAQGQSESRDEVGGVD